MPVGKGNQTMDQLDVIKEFQRRRKVYFKKSAPALGLVAAGFLLLFFLKDKLDSINPFLSVLAFAIFGAGSIWEAQLTQKIYRCPACNSVPMRGWGYAGTMHFSNGLYLNPHKCPNCSVLLK